MAHGAACLEDAGSRGNTSIAEGFPQAFRTEDMMEPPQKPKGQGTQASDVSKGRLAKLNHS